MKMGVMRRRPSLVLVSICLLCCSQTNVIPLHHCSRLQWTAMHILNITLSLDHQSYLLLRWSSSLGRKGRSFHRLDASRVTQPTVSKQSHATTNAYNTHTYTHARLTALFPGLSGWAGTRKVKQSGFCWSKRQWVAVASAGQHASLHLAPDT